MKKTLFFAAIIFLFTCSSCNNDSGGLSAKAKANLEAQHGVIKCFDTKDFSKLGDYIAEDFIDHAGQSGEVKGLANNKAEFEKMVETIESNKSEILLELANDEYVMSLIRFTGKLKADNPGMGMKAGDSFDMKSMELSRFKDGKAIEHWVYMDPAEMMKMMKTMNASITPTTLTTSDSGSAKPAGQ